MQMTISSTREMQDIPIRDPMEEARSLMKSRILKKG